MRRPCGARRRTRGFVLLYTLWLLIGATLIFGLVVRFAVDRSGVVVAERDQLIMEATAESALHDQLFGLLARGQRTPGAPRLDPSVARIAAASGRSDGLIDLNHADEQWLVQLFSRLGGRDAQATFEKLRLKRPIASYAELVAATGLNEAELACLLQRATLFSARRMPEPDAAPELVRALLGLPQRSATIEVAGSVAAFDTTRSRPWWILVEVQGPLGAMRRLRTEVIVTNRADRPFGVLDRRWLDANVSLGSCS